MRYLQGLKSVNERVRIGETNMWVYMDGIIHEIGAGVVHIEIDIGLDFWEIAARVSGNESGRECERFKIIHKVLDIQGDMQDGDVLWEEAKAHAQWVIESMGRGISGASRCTESGFWFGDEKRLANQYKKDANEDSAFDPLYCSMCGGTWNGKPDGLSTGACSGAIEGWCHIHKTKAATRHIPISQTWVPMPANMKACHICDGDCDESGCLIGVRNESVNAGDDEKGVKTQPLFPFPNR